MSRYRHIQDALLQQTQTSMNRRVLMKRAGMLGFAATGFSALLAACGGDDDPTATTAPETAATATTGADATAAPQEATPTAGAGTTPAPQAATATPGTSAPPATTAPDPTATADTSAVTSGGEVRWHYGSAPRTFNPLFSTSNREHAFEALMYGAIAKIGDGFEPMLDLAETIEVSPDATVYTFTLHDNIMFTDGEQLTSEDVRFTFERAINRSTASVWRGRLLSIQGAADFDAAVSDSLSGISTPDDLTIEFTLEAPDAVFFLSICGTGGFGILPQHILGDVAPEELAQHEFSRAPTVTAGAFKFGRYEVDQFMVFERNDDYYGTPANLDRIIGVIVTSSVAQAQLQTGELDIVPFIEFDEVERTRALPNVEINSVRSATVSKLVFNLNREYFQNKLVRQGMAYAIDAQGILDAALLGEGFVIHAPFSAPEWTDQITGMTEYNYDPDRARELLAEGGWDSNQAIEFIFAADTNPWWITTLTIIQQMWADVGVTVGLAPIDFAELNVRSLENDNFDFRVLGGSVGDPDQATATLATSGIPPGGTNYARYSNPRVDELFVMGRASGNIDERIAIYTELAQIISEDVPEIYLFAPNNISAYASRVRGASAPAFRDNTVWDAASWYIEEA